MLLPTLLLILVECALNRGELLGKDELIGRAAVLLGDGRTRAVSRLVNLAGPVGGRPLQRLATLQVAASWSTAVVCQLT